MLVTGTEEPALRMLQDRMSMALRAPSFWNMEVKSTPLEVFQASTPFTVARLWSFANMPVNSWTLLTSRPEPSKSVRLA